MKKRKIRKLVTLAVCFSLLVGLMASTAAYAAVQSPLLRVSNGRTIMVAGKTYRVTNKKASNFKSSNVKVASISKTGVITPKKTGYATISATVNGKKISRKFLFTDAQGTTLSQTNLNKLLCAKDLSTITLKNLTGSQTYVVPKVEGTQNKKLVIQAPNSQVTVNSSFDQIEIGDQVTTSEGTVHVVKNAGTGPKVKLEKTDGAPVVMGGKAIIIGNADSVTAVNAVPVAISSTASVGTMIVSEGSATVNGNVGTIVIASSDILIGGSDNDTGAAISGDSGSAGSTASGDTYIDGGAGGDNFNMLVSGNNNIAIGKSASVDMCCGSDGAKMNLTVSPNVSANLDVIAVSGDPNPIPVKPEMSLSGDLSNTVVNVSGDESLNINVASGATGRLVLNYAGGRVTLGPSGTTSIEDGIMTQFFDPTTIVIADPPEHVDGMGSPSRPSVYPKMIRSHYAK